MRLSVLITLCLLYSLVMDAIGAPLLLVLIPVVMVSLVWDHIWDWTET